MSTLLPVGINTAPLYAPQSGVGRYIRALLAALERGGMIEPLALFGPRAPAGGRAVRLLRPWIKRFAPRPYAIADAARGLSVWRRRREISVYHETNHVAPRLKMPTVITVHDLSTILHPSTQDPERARHFARAMPEAVQRAARVIVPTEAVRREVIEILRAPPERVVVVHHGVEARFTPDGPREPPAPLVERGVRGRFILYLGNVEPRKNLAVLIEAYRRLPSRVQRELPLVLCGDRSRAPGLHEGPAGEGRVVIPGRIDEADLPALYRAARVLCYPSLYEGFGLPLVEAMAVGTPVVASDIAAHREVAGNAALLAAPDDADAIAASLLRAVDDELVRAEYATRGKMRAAAFTWDESARKHAAVYTAVADER